MKPVEPINFGWKITEDMTWKEKFQTYCDATTTQEHDNVVGAGNIAVEQDNE